MTWYQAWLKAIFRPSGRTYEEILRSLGEGTNKPILWLFFAAWAELGLSGLATVIRGDHLQLRWIVYSPIAAAGVLVLVVVVLAAISLLARLLGGTGTLGVLFRLVSATFPPIFIAGGIFWALAAVIPPLYFLSTLCAVYQFALLIFMIRWSNNLSWWRSVASTLPLVGLPLITQFL